MSHISAVSYIFKKKMIKRDGLSRRLSIKNNSIFYDMYYITYWIAFMKKLFELTEAVKNAKKEGFKARTNQKISPLVKTLSCFVAKWIIINTKKNYANTFFNNKVYISTKNKNHTFFCNFHTV